MQSGQHALYADEYNDTFAKLKLLTKASGSIPNASTPDTRFLVTSHEDGATIKIAPRLERDQDALLVLCLEVKIISATPEKAETFAREAMNEVVQSYIDERIFNSFKAEHLCTRFLRCNRVRVSVKWKIAESEVTGEALQEQNGSTLSISGPQICALATDTLAGFLLAKKEESKDAATQRPAKRAKGPDKGRPNDD